MTWQTGPKVVVGILGGVFLFFGILALVSLGTIEPAEAWELVQGSCITSTVSSDVVTHATWTAACSPYIVLTDTVSIRHNATLTIESGVKVQFQSGSQMQVVDGGQLYAVGTSGNPITFTSHVTVPGPARGDWLGILIDNSALTTTIKYATIEYAKTGINIAGPSIIRHTIQHNRLRYNGDGDTGGAIYGTPDYHDISANEVYSCSVGFKFNKAFNNTILSNTFHAIDSHAIWFFQGSSVGGDDNLVGYNVIHDCGGDGIRWEKGDDNHIVDNMIYDCDGDGIHWENGNDNIIEKNAICVTCFGGRYNLENLDGVITAAGNWWGTNTPTHTVEVTGSVDLTPWVSLAITRADATLPADGVSTTVITVTMNDGVGRTVPPLARIITLTAFGGTVPPTVTLDSQGIATATFTSMAGMATTAIVTATEFCGEKVTATMELEAFGVDLVVTKEDGVGPTSAGLAALLSLIGEDVHAIQWRDHVWESDVVTYTIAIVNIGPYHATGTYVTETLPANTSFVTGTCLSPPACAGNAWSEIGTSGVYSIAVGTLPPTDGAVVEFVVRITDSLPSGVTEVINHTCAKSDQTDLNTYNNCASQQTPLSPYTVFLPVILCNYPYRSDNIPVGAHPKSLVISEDHNRVYVTLFDDDGHGNPGGDGQLAVLDLTTREVEAKVPTGGSNPMGIAIRGNRLYVVNNGSDNLSVMNAISLAVLQTIPVGDSPFGVAVTDDRIYVTNFDDGTLSIIDATTHAVINTVTVGRHPAFPAAWGDCAYVPNHSGGEGVTVVCDDGADIYRLREEWGYFAATFYPNPRASWNPLIILSRRDGWPGLYEISVDPPYGFDKPVLKKRMLNTPPFAIAYNSTTDHLLVVLATSDELHVIYPGSYTTGTVWPLPRQNEGPEWHGGQGVDAVGHEVWVANYADGSISVLLDP